jgi:predicted nucleic-acid-binding Zn-ribbon protein
MNEEQLPPYDPDAFCVKCGCSDASTEYRSNVRCLHDANTQVFTGEPSEFLHRRCMNCGYQWDEAVLA